MPAVPRMIGAVGKSGPFTYSISPSDVIAGSAMKAWQAAITSPRLCGGMLVAMPTAMPPAPLTSRLGKRAGRTCGSRSLSVIIRREVDRVLVDVAEQEVGDLGEARFGVAHRRGRIGIHRAEIALAVDQRHAHRPVLGHARQRVVDRAVAVRMVFAHHVADDAARLAIGAAGDIARFLAGIEDAAVDRLEPVADVGQRARDDHAHRIIEIAGLHLVDDRDGSDVAADGRVDVVGRRQSRQGNILLAVYENRGCGGRRPVGSTASRSGRPTPPPRARA